MTHSQRSAERPLTVVTARYRHARARVVLAASLVVCCAVATAQQPSSQAPPTGTVTSKLIRYARRVVARHDANGDGHLDTGEWTAMQGNPAAADLNRDGQINVDEFARYVASHGAGRRIRLSTMRDSGAQRTPTVARPDSAGEAETDDAADAGELVLKRRRGLKYFSQLPDGVPGWFVERDTDGDSQLTLAEYSPKLRTAEVAEFKSYDLNGDGLLTAAELSGKARKTVPPNAPLPAGPLTPK